MNTDMIFKRNGFTMIELVFVIVVLGILAAIAIPRFAATRDDAQIAKGRSDVAAVRAAIVSERQGRLMKGESIYISKLHHSSTTLFDGNGSSTLLQYGIAVGNGNGKWNNPVCNGTPSVCTYDFNVLNKAVTFKYTQVDGKFECNTTNGTYGNECKLLIN